jgi:hypothetical protein
MTHPESNCEMDTDDRYRSAATKSLTRPAHSVSHRRGKCVLIMKVNSLKNNLNFVKDVTIMYVNFIIIVFIV